MGIAKSKIFGGFTEDTGATKANADPVLVTKAKATPEKMSPAEWEQVLTSIQMEVAREAGTERAFTGHLWDNKEKGTHSDFFMYLTS